MEFCAPHLAALLPATGLTISEWTGDRVASLNPAAVAELDAVLAEWGARSAAAQGIGVISDLQRLVDNPGHTLYIAVASRGAR